MMPAQASGMTLATATMAPFPPSINVGSTMSAEPDNALTLSPQSLITSAMLPGFPLLSFMATSPLHSSDILATTRGSTLYPVNLGTLYRITGRSTALNRST